MAEAGKKYIRIGYVRSRAEKQFPYNSISRPSVGRLESSRGFKRDPRRGSLGDRARENLGPARIPVEYACIDLLSIRKRGFKYSDYFNAISQPGYAAGLGEDAEGRDAKSIAAKFESGLALRLYLTAKRGDLWAYCVSSMEIFEARKRSSSRGVYQRREDRTREMTPESKRRE